MSVEGNDGDFGLDDLLDELSRRIDERRKSGAYPPELEERMDRHAQAILGKRSRIGTVTAQLEAGIENARDLARFPSYAASTESRIPGGSAVHGLFGRLASRHMAAIREEMRQFAETLIAVTEDLRADLMGELNAIQETLAKYEGERQMVGSNLEVLEQSLTAELGTN